MHSRPWPHALAGKTLQSITILWTLMCQGFDGAPAALRSGRVVEAATAVVRARSRTWWRLRPRVLEAVAVRAWRLQPNRMEPCDMEPCDNQTAIL